jgi:hypothetical protein
VSLPLFPLSLVKERGNKRGRGLLQFLYYFCGEKDGSGIYGGSSYKK